MTKVLVVLGGESSEREISLRSGAAVAAALTQAGYAVRQYDLANGKEGLMTEARQADVVFPVLHGAGGEDGTIQSMLELERIPFVGSGSDASKLCFNKIHYKHFLQSNSFDTPNGELVDIFAFAEHELKHKPFVLKPKDGGSSIDTFIIRDPNQIPVAEINDAFGRHNEMLLEELIGGQEITVPILGNISLPVIEIVPPDNGEFDFENKYNGASRELCPPQHVSVETQLRAQALALQIHNLAGCKNMSRTDMIIDGNQKLWVLETNTIPGLTEQSLFPKAAAEEGITMPQLVDLLVRS
jgi:D-alanine-D-alanine ligase